MTREIYNRMPDDKNFRIDLETTSDIELILQLIRMILGTVPGEVLGSPAFGINIKQYLFNYSIDKDTIRDIINNAFSNYLMYDPDKYTIDVDVNFGTSSDKTSDYALIDIKINELKYMGIMITLA